MRKAFLLISSLVLALSLLAGCGEAAPASSAASIAASLDASASSAVSSEATPQAALPDGVYTADFETDSGMFGVNEACGGKGTLMVENGEMTIHVSLISQKILNLYAGFAQEAQKDEAAWLQPSIDTVTYSDGITEETYGFDIPVPGIDEEFDVALVGTKGTWYDHKVSVQNPVPQEDAADAQPIALEEGDYTVAVAMEGGTGRASVQSPAMLHIENGGKAMATLVWSSSNYDYMKVNGVRYDMIAGEEFSTFEIPVEGFDSPLLMIADTVAMSEPHEIEYTFTFDSATIQKVDG